MGIMHLFKEVVENGIKVRILIHADENQIREIVNEVMLVFPEIDIRAIEMSLDTSIGIVVVDRKQSLIVETKDDTKDNSYEASGLAAYSNSKYIATSYASIFESLWIQAELYEQLKEANKQLKIHGKMKKFKSIAIVGDDAYLVNLFSETLKMNGYDVCSFTEPILAYNHIKENWRKYSLLITDHRMSQMNGLFLATKLLEINPKMNVIIISTCDNLECNYKFNILKKPISIYKLIKVVNESIPIPISNHDKSNLIY
jgi:PleD family two-component response regulator